MRDLSELTDLVDPVVIDDPITYDAINDPLRWRLWNLLQRPMSAKELSLALGLPAGRLYYHLDRLARHGWIEVVEERPARTRPERVWRARHSGYRLEGAAQEVAAGGPSGAALGMVDDIAQEMAGTIPVDDDVEHTLELVVRGRGFLDAAQSEQLAKDLIALAGRYFPDNDTEPPHRDRDGGAAPRRYYRLAAAVSAWS